MEVSDPEAIENARVRYPQLSYAATAEDAVSGVDLVILVTAWNQFVRLDPSPLAARVRHARIIDANNALDPGSWRAAGWTYRGMGRP